MLLVDDIQFLASAVIWQEEFFHTFNTLHSMGKQIVITGDVEPLHMQRIDENLRSRFAGGLVVEVGTPSESTRRAVVAKRAAEQGIQIEPPVVDMLVERAAGSVRELEGALTRVVALAAIWGRTTVNAEMAEHAMQALNRQKAGPPTIDRVQKVVCDQFGITHDDLMGASRATRVSRPRQIAMYLARVVVGATCTYIGERFGRDHSTVSHAEKNVNRLMLRRPRAAGSRL